MGFLLLAGSRSATECRRSHLHRRGTEKGPCPASFSSLVHGIKVPVLGWASSSQSSSLKGRHGLSLLGRGWAWEWHIPIANMTSSLLIFSTGDLSRSSDRWLADSFVPERW